MSECLFNKVAGLEPLLAKTLLGIFNQNEALNDLLVNLAISVTLFKFVKFPISYCEDSGGSKMLKQNNQILYKQNIFKQKRSFKSVPGTRYFRKIDKIL